MLGPNLFFKKARTDTRPTVLPLEHRNSAVAPVLGHPRFGFRTILDREVKPLPTAPAVVGGNVDWTRSRVTPVTNYLHQELSKFRPMIVAPAIGSFLKLGEPSRDSIHTTY